jgi:hypothetical protein
MVVCSLGNRYVVGRCRVSRADRRLEAAQSPIWLWQPELLIASRRFAPLRSIEIAMVEVNAAEMGAAEIGPAEVGPSVDDRPRTAPPILRGWLASIGIGGWFASESVEWIGITGCFAPESAT